MRGLLRVKVVLFSKSPPLSARWGVVTCVPQPPWMAFPSVCYTLHYLVCKVVVEPNVMHLTHNSCTAQYSVPWGCLSRNASPAFLTGHTVDIHPSQQRSSQERACHPILGNGKMRHPLLGPASRYRRETRQDACSLTCPGSCAWSWQLGMNVVTWILRMAVQTEGKDLHLDNASALSMCLTSEILVIWRFKQGFYYLCRKKQSKWFNKHLNVSVGRRRRGEWSQLF